MNIGFFTDSYSPLIDGVAVSTKLFKKALERLGHQVYVFAPGKMLFKAHFPVEEERNVFRFRSIPSVIAPGYPLAIPFSSEMHRFISKLKLDVVHVNCPYTMGALGLITAWKKKIPAIGSFRGNSPEQVKYHFAKGKIITPKMVWAHNIFFYYRCQHTTVLSKKFERLLREQGFRKDITVLPTGIDIDEFKDVDRRTFRERYHIPAHRKVLLFVGRTAGEKNIDFLLEMMIPLIRQIRDAMLVIIGDAKYRKVLERLTAKLGLKDSVLFTGFLPRKETMQAYAASDIFVFSSKADTQAMVLFEAAASGLPIVMLEDQGLNNVVVDSKNGFVVKEDNPELFANKVTEILQNPDLYQGMSRQSKELAQKCSIEKQTRKLIELYEKFIKHSS